MGLLLLHLIGFELFCFYCHLSLGIVWFPLWFLQWSIGCLVACCWVSTCFNILHFKVYFVWCEYCYSSFLLIPVCMKYFLPSSHFQFVCVPRSEVGLWKTAYVWILFLYPFSQSMSLGRAFSPLTFKVIIDMHVLIAILLIALDLFLLLFFLPFSCSLLFWFDDYV